MALTKPRFVQPNSSKSSQESGTHRSIFDIDAFLDSTSFAAVERKNPFELKTSVPIFHGKEKTEEFNSSIFEVRNYKKDFEDPGIYSLTHFDEPILHLRNAYGSGSSTPESLISVGRFALSPASSRRSSLFPDDMTPDFAKHYIPGLQTPSLDPDRKIDQSEIRKILINSFTFLEAEKYNGKRCRNLSKNLSDYVLYQLKILDYERYKFTCIVNIGQNLGQDIRVVSRSLWNDQTDTYISESFQNKELFAVAMVFAVYQE